MLRHRVLQAMDHKANRVVINPRPPPLTLHPLHNSPADMVAILRLTLNSLATRLATPANRMVQPNNQVSRREAVTVTQAIHQAIQALSRDTRLHQQRKLNSRRTSISKVRGVC